MGSFRRKGDSQTDRKYDRAREKRLLVFTQAFAEERKEKKPQLWRPPTPSFPGPTPKGKKPSGVFELISATSLVPTCCEVEGIEGEGIYAVERERKGNEGKE
jgi:hypothetical protein